MIIIKNDKVIEKKNNWRHGAPPAGRPDGARRRRQGAGRDVTGRPVVPQAAPGQPVWGAQEDRGQYRQKFPIIWTFF